MARRNRRRNFGKPQEEKVKHLSKKEIKKQLKQEKKGSKMSYYVQEKETKNDLPRILFPAKLYDKLFLYTREASGEISGVGTVDFVDKNFVVEELFLLEQKAGAASTDLDPEAVAKLMEQFIIEDRDLGKMKLWWHTHASMGVFWSGTDDNTINGFKNNWMISVVSNKAGNILGRIDIYNPFRLTFNAEVVRVSEPNVELLEEVKREIAEKVKGYSYNIPTTGAAYPGRAGFVSFSGKPIVNQEDWMEEGYYAGVPGIPQFRNRQTVSPCAHCGKFKYTTSAKLGDGTDVQLCLSCEETIKENVEVGQCEFCGEIGNPVKTVMLGENITIVCSECETNLGSYYPETGEQKQ